MHKPNFPKSIRSLRRGFTLIELLVTIGILVALTALSLAAIVHAKKKGTEIRIQSDLGLIGTALEAYKADFGDYPRFDDGNDVDSLNVQQDRGARLLCRALLSPGPESLTSPQSKIGFDANNKDEGAPDGADGPGFRLRSGGVGKIQPAYLDASKFKLGNSGTASYDSQYFKDATILDINGNSILYYPAFTTASISGTNAAYVTAFDPPGNGATPSANHPRPFYNAEDNDHYGSTATGKFLLPGAHLAYILGDRNQNGFIDQGESATANAPYLLWSAGVDGIFGFGIDPSTGQPWTATAIQASKLKIDDITNFSIAGDLRK